MYSTIDGATSIPDGFFVSIDIDCVTYQFIFAARCECALHTCWFFATSFVKLTLNSFGIFSLRRQAAACYNTLKMQFVDHFMMAMINDHLHQHQKLIHLDHNLNQEKFYEEIITFFLL